jgi:hypothetical protein
VGAIVFGWGRMRGKLLLVISNAIRDRSGKT